MKNIIHWFKQTSKQTHLTGQCKKLYLIPGFPFESIDNHKFFKTQICVINFIGIVVNTSVFLEISGPHVFDNLIHGQSIETTFTYPNTLSSPHPHYLLLPIYFPLFFHVFMCGSCAGRHSWSLFIVFGISKDQKITFSDSDFHPRVLVLPPPMTLWCSLNRCKIEISFRIKNSTITYFQDSEQLGASALTINHGKGSLGGLVSLKQH